MVSLAAVSNLTATSPPPGKRHEQLIPTRSPPDDKHVNKAGNYRRPLEKLLDGSCDRPAIEHPTQSLLSHWSRRQVGLQLWRSI